MIVVIGVVRQSRLELSSVDVFVGQRMRLSGLATLELLEDITDLLIERCICLSERLEWSEPTNQMIWIASMASSLRLMLSWLRLCDLHRPH